jgi:hypothetical protein
VKSAEVFHNFIKGVALLGFNIPPLGALTLGVRGYVPPHMQRFQGEIFDTAGLALRRFIPHNNPAFWDIAITNANTPNLNSFGNYSARICLKTPFYSILRSFRTKFTKIPPNLAFCNSLYYKELEYG